MFEQSMIEIYNLHNRVSAAQRIRDFHWAIYQVITLYESNKEKDENQCNEGERGRERGRDEGKTKV